MSEFLKTDADRRYSLSEWNALAMSNPAEHRAAHSEGRVDLPNGVRSALQHSRSEQRPIGFQSMEDGVGYLSDLSAREQRTAEQTADDAPLQPEEGDGETSAPRLTHQEWTALSASDPAAAIEAHRAGRVDFPPHIAEQLQANREPRIGG